MKAMHSTSAQYTMVCQQSTVQRSRHHGSLKLTFSKTTTARDNRLTAPSCFPEHCTDCCIAFSVSWENKAASEQVIASESALEAAKGAHAIAVLTEWDEFKTLDWKAVLDGMQRPAFVFDGRNILDHDHLRELGFIVYALGKPLDPFILGN